MRKRKNPDELTFPVPLNLIRCVSNKDQLVPEVGKLTLLSLLVYCVIVSHFNLKKDALKECWRSLAGLAKMCGKSLSAVRRARNALVTAGFLDMSYRFVSGDAALQSVRFATEPEIREAQRRIKDKKNASFVAVLTPPSKLPSESVLLEAGYLPEIEEDSVLDLLSNLGLQFHPPGVSADGSPAPVAGGATALVGEENYNNPKDSHLNTPNREKEEKEFPSSHLGFVAAHIQLADAYKEYQAKLGGLRAEDIVLSPEEYQHAILATKNMEKLQIEDPATFVNEGVDAWLSSLSKPQTIYLKHLANPLTVTHIAFRKKESLVKVEKAAKSRAAFNRALTLKDDEEYFRAHKRIKEDNFDHFDLYYWAERYEQINGKRPYDLDDKLDYLTARAKGEEAVVEYKIKMAGRRIERAAQNAHKEKDVDKLMRKCEKIIEKTFMSKKPKLDQAVFVAEAHLIHHGKIPRRITRAIDSVKDRPYFKFVPQHIREKVAADLGVTS